MTTPSKVVRNHAVHDTSASVRSVATDAARSVVSESACLPDTPVNPANSDEPTRIRFDGDLCGPTKHVLD